MYNPSSLNNLPIEPFPSSILAKTELKLLIVVCKSLIVLPRLALAKESVTIDKFDVIVSTFVNALFICSWLFSTKLLRLFDVSPKEAIVVLKPAILFLRLLMLKPTPYMY